jgi:type IV pilus assembly protein PilA
MKNVHKLMNRKNQGAFTLIELMIVVAIIGILAVLAVYGVSKYIANAKTAEARNSLGQITKDIAAAYERESMNGAPMAEGGTTGVTRALCMTAAQSIPAAAASIKGQKYQSKKTDWAPAGDVAANRGFPCIRFVMDAPQYFMYMYTSDSDTGANPISPGTNFTATAQGDLNGDGVVSTFTTKGNIDATTKRLLVSPNITEDKPEE